MKRVRKLKLGRKDRVKKLHKQRHLKPIFFVTAFGLFGAAILILTFAATSNYSIEPETSTVSGNASTVADATASGGNAVKFNQAVSSGPCAVTTPNVPDGPDPWGGCWPGPSNTGPTYTPTKTLTPVPTNGNRYVLDNAVTLDGYVFNYGILVRGQNVVIKNSIINTTIEVYETGSLTIEDSEVHGGDAYWATMGGFNYDLIRTDIEGGQQSSICSGGCDWSDVYSHDPHYFPTQDAHQSAFATTGIENGEPISLRHSTLWCNVPVAPSGGGCTGDLALQPNFGVIENVTIDKNLFMESETGSYCATFGYGPSSYSEYAPLENHVVVTNNIFKKGPTGKCGFYGPVTSYNRLGAGNQWVNNKWDDGTALNCLASDCE